MACMHGYATGRCRHRVETKTASWGRSTPLKTFTWLPAALPGPRIQPQTAGPPAGCCRSKHCFCVTQCVAALVAQQRSVALGRPNRRASPALADTSPLNAAHHHAHKSCNFTVPAPAASTPYIAARRPCINTLHTALRPNQIKLCCSYVVPSPPRRWIDTPSTLRVPPAPLHSDCSHPATPARPHPPPPP